MECKQRQLRVTYRRDYEFIPLKPFEIATGVFSQSWLRVSKLSYYSSALSTRVRDLVVSTARSTAARTDGQAGSGRTEITPQFSGNPASRATRVDLPWGLSTVTW